MNLNMQEPEEDYILALLQNYNAVIDELLQWGVSTTRNAPTGDYAEWLVRRRLNLIQAPVGQRAYDASDGQANTYQIKGRIATHNSVGLGTIRQLDERLFNYLIVVIFNTDFTVRHVYKIPHRRVNEVATFSGHVNGHTVTFNRAKWQQLGIEEITHLFL